METIRIPLQQQKQSEKYRGQGKTIGFVPTMGYLHQGHTSLMKKARQETEIVVVSIFVNPTQFAPGEDYEKYPRDLERDLDICRSEGVDIVFLPERKDMYYPTSATYVEEKNLSKILEGKSRPTHFRGVTTVVCKLFNIVKPHIAYFGAKDWQQAIIVTRMVEDLDIDTEIKILPTVREADGLAVSSRNSYFNEKERKAATILYRSLQEAREMIEAGERDAQKVEKRVKQTLEGEKLATLDYIAICDPYTLEPLSTVKDEAILLLAAYIGKVRLIDNLKVKRSI